MSNLSEQKSSLIHSFNQKKYNKVSKIYKRNKEFYLKEPEITKLAVTSEFYLKNYLQAENYLRNIDPISVLSENFSDKCINNGSFAT